MICRHLLKLEVQEKHLCFFIAFPHTAPPSRVTTEPSRLPVAIVTTNFTFMAFISNMTLGTHSIRLSDKSGMLIPSARYSLQSRPRVYAGTCGVQVAISIFNVQQSDIRQYWLSVQQAPNPPTLLELPKLSVISKVYKYTSAGIAVAK